MKKFLSSSLLLGLLYFILFYTNEFGISVILFMGPLMLMIYWYLKDNDLIKNKNGLLFLIPIFLLSLTYLIFDNTFFREANRIVIILLIILMYIYTLKPEFRVSNIFNDVLNIFVEPFRNIFKGLNDLKSSLKENLHISDKVFKGIGSFLIVVPVIVIVLVLLSSADVEFSNLLNKVLELPKKIFENFNFYEFIGKIFETIIFLGYFLGTMYYLSDRFLKNKNDGDFSLKKGSQAILILLVSLNIIYVLFDIIQIKSLMLNYVSKNINYAEYAREGFFQLMVVSIINMIIILVAKQYNDKNSKLIKVFSLIMILLTFVIIISSILRMNLYESMYGYTLLRLFVYIILFTEMVLIIPLVMYVLNNKFNIVRAAIIIVTTIYIIINFLNLDSIIAKRNIKRYYDKEDIDIEYLENYSTDNISDLVRFYEEIDDTEIKENLNQYFKNIDIDYGIRGFNISKYIAKNKIKSYR